MKNKLNKTESDEPFEIKRSVLLKARICLFHRQDAVS